MASTAYAQTPSARIAAALARFESADRNSGPEVARRLEAIVSGLVEVDLEADPVARARVESFLSKLVRADVGEHRGRLRAAALLALGRCGRLDATGRLILAFAARAGAPTSVLAEDVARAVAELAPSPALERVVERGLRDADDVVSAIVLDGIANLARPESRARVAAESEALRRSLAHENPAVRAAAARAVGRLDVVILTGDLRAMAMDADSLVRREVATALNPSPAEIDLWRHLLADAAPAVREAAIESVGACGEVRMAGLLVERLDVEGRRLRHALGLALRELSGVDLDAEAGPWESWWTAMQREIDLAGDGPLPTLKIGARDRYAATWYGIPVASDRCLFIIDISMSMRFGGNSVTPCRMDLAKRELRRTIAELARDTRFAITAFSTGVTRFDRRGLVPADPATRARAERWVDGLVPAGGTDTYGALRDAFSRYADIDTIYILSDGRPSRGALTDPDAILSRLGEMNARRRVRINTVALLSWAPGMTDDDRSEGAEEAARFMAELARRNGGEFRRID